MKCKVLSLIFLTHFFLVCVSAQLINNGATITVQNGAYIMSTGDVRNSGTIINNGKIETQGNFINSGTYNSTGNEDSLILTGSGPDTLTGGSSVINYLTINKTSNTDIVRLGGTTTVNTKLDYLSGAFTTDPVLNSLFTLTSSAGATYNFTAGREIVGSVKRTGWSNGTMQVFNQANMQVTTNAGTSPTDFTVTMIPQSGGGDPTQSEREVKRYFLFDNTNGSGFTADIRYPYLATELNTNIEANLVPWLLQTDWNARLAATRDIANDYVQLTGITPTELDAEWKLADPKYTFNVTAYIKGDWNNPSGTMRTTLNFGGLLPLSQPYSAPPFNYAGSEFVGSIPNANIVDWVLVDFRKPTSGLPADAVAGTFIGRKAAFLLSNGMLVDTDGFTPLSFNITKQGSGYLVVRHRNHLAVMSNSLPSNASGSYTNNFSIFSNSYKKPTASSDPTVLLATSGAGSTLYGMWPGDVNVSGSITTADVTPINIAIAGPASGNANVYNPRDINLDKNVTTADVSITNTSVAAFASSSSAKPQGTENVLTSHVPAGGN
ncbi:MAG: hypothetical protein WKF35_08975 [Ferruginibacter sp.]